MKQIIFTTATLALLALTVVTSCSKDESAEIPAEITFAPDLDNSPIDSETGTKTISFTATQPWKAGVEAEKEWCTIALGTTKAAASADTKAASSLAGGAGENVVITITATVNNTYEERTASITIISGKVEKEFVVTQAGATPPTPEIEIITPANKEVNIESTLDATATVTFSSALAAWTATIKSEDTWCLIEGEAAGEKGDKQTITLKASSANTLFTPRTATLTITPADGTPTELTVTQKSATAPTGDLLVSITAPATVTGVDNGTSAATILSSLPTTVTLVTDGDNASAPVKWTAPSVEDYNPALEDAQIFTITGIVTLPEGVINTNNVSLETSVSITVTSQGISGGDLEEGGDW